MVWESPVVAWDLCDTSRQEDLRLAWAAGALSHVLDPVQLVAHNEIVERNAATDLQTERLHVMDWARRSGKDSVMSVLATETAIQRPGCRIPYGAPTQKMVTEILEPIFARNFLDCPPDFMPTWHAQKSEWRWPHGSRIVLVGCDMHPDRLRGPSTGAWFLTEPGFIDDLEKVLQSILIPQMLTEPASFGVMGSTPPETPASYWSTTVVPRARARGCYSRRTIESNPRITPAVREAFIEEAGGRDSSKCQREYFAMHVIEETMAIVPEYHKVKGMADEQGVYHGGIITDDYMRPAHFDGYVVIDPGMVDLFAGLFAFYDFEGARLVIEDDFALPLANTQTAADEIARKEKELWGGCEGWWGEGRLKPQPYMRVSDTDLRLIADLRSQHGLTFVATPKDNRDAAINALRLRFQRKQIIIHPRCKNLIAHLDGAVWNKHKTDFARSGELGHFDCVAALVYLDRNINRSHNPVPPITHRLDQDHAVDPFVRDAERRRAQGAVGAIFESTGARKRLMQRPTRPGSLPGE